MVFVRVTATIAKWPPRGVKGHRNVNRGYRLLLHSKAPSDKIKSLVSIPEALLGASGFTRSKDLCVLTERIS
ncbi:hypothetical protein RRG08_001135 [Elysia crispata]|uniref:Uncharacterized protein n=1 Tax=Elysia crispata TaxID=231223 RepID=A0AAE0Y153_9GAST|nr:hypothetical protein RRG08_001135 [Elysia crispata]